MISCLVSLFSTAQSHTNQSFYLQVTLITSQILAEAVPSTIHALVIALCCHNPASSKYNAIEFVFLSRLTSSSCEYETHSSFQRAVCDLKKVVRESVTTLMKTQYQPVMTQITSMLAQTRVLRVVQLPCPHSPVTSFLPFTPFSRAQWRV